jgi:hypothetical protein
VWACAIGFPPITIEAEDGFAELVAFDGEFGGLAEGAAERPMARAGGPDGDDRSGWICAVFQPVAAAVWGVVVRKVWTSLDLR